MPHGDAGKVDARRLARLGHAEGRRRTGVGAVLAQGHLGGEFGNVGEQLAQFLGLGAVVQGGDELDGALERSR
jgi:hypothetical protein